MGGDEFAIVLPAADADTDAEAVQRVRAGLAEPVHLNGIHLTVAASVGTATGVRAHAAAVLHQADAAMYAAKQAGRGGFVPPGQG